MINETLVDAESRMIGAVTTLEEHLASISTGRASPTLFEKLDVDYYGTPTPLQQLATIAVPEPQSITIRPFDPGSLNDIEKAIQLSDLGLTPLNDGKIIRLNIPPLNEERRKEKVQTMNKRLEEARVAARNVRRDALETLRELEGEKLIGEDDFHRAKDDLQKLIDQYVGQIDEVGKHKEQEILEF